MSKIKKIINILIFLSISTLILFLNIGTIDLILNYRDYLLFSKILIIFGFILFVLYLVNKIINKEKLKIKDFIIILLSLFGIISYIFAIDRNVALFGSYGRNEGLLVILTYYIIFLASSNINKKYQKIIMNILLFTGVFQVFIGSFQFFKLENIFGYNRSYNFSTNFEDASGTLGNPNFYSTYILICLLYSYGNLLKSKEKINKIIYFTLTIYFIYGLFIGDTLSCLISFIIIFIITMLKKLNKSNIKKVLFIMAILLIGAIFSINTLDDLFKTNIHKSIKKNINEVSYIFLNGINDDTGKGRIYVWKESLKTYSNNVLTGIGIDNFGVAFNGNYLKYEHDGKIQYFDKIHNEYLQKLVTEGIFSFLTYMSLLIYIIYKYFKSKKDDHKYCLFLCFMGYLIQAFINISVIPVAPIFYMIMGFIINEDIVIE